MKKKKFFLIATIIFLLALITGVTLAFVKNTMQGSKRQVITTADFFIELKEEDELIIEDALPMYDEVGIIGEAFHFQVVNKSNQDINYVLYLKDTTEDGVEKLSYEDVKYHLTKENTEYEARLLTELEEWKLDEGRSKSNSTIHYALRLWIKEEITENEQIENKVLKFKLEMDTTNDIRERYTIKYETGIEDVIEEEIKIEGEEYYIPSTKLEKVGYVFLGWSTKEGSSVAEYAPNGIYQGNQNTIFYAVWTKAKYVITYHANTGVNPPSSQEKEYGVALNISSSIPTKTGYTFQGWSTTLNGAVEYQPNSRYEKNENITLYAVWKINTYTVSYNANGGSGVPSAQTKTYGVTLKLSTTKPTRTGYTFQGWSTSSTATSASYASGASFTSNANTTLYAVWKLSGVQAKAVSPELTSQTMGNFLQYATITTNNAAFVYSNKSFICKTAGTYTITVTASATAGDSSSWHGTVYINDVAQFNTFDGETRSQKVTLKVGDYIHCNSAAGSNTNGYLTLTITS